MRHPVGGPARLSGGFTQRVNRGALPMPKCLMRNDILQMA